MRCGGAALGGSVGYDSLGVLSRRLTTTGSRRIVR